jgi:methylase of polypeptide subunit release factors
VTIAEKRVAAKRSPVEFGDFQTPVSLANQVLKIARDRIQHEPKSIFEPTCGVGNLLFAALETFPNVSQARGFEINPAYVLEAKSRSSQLQVSQADFFTINLEDIFAQLEQPVLIVGNPPWVTNAAIAASGGTNLPSKQTQQGFNGLQAMTGKSNFDLSEAILQRLLERISRTQNTLAMIVKTAVARKLLQHASRPVLSIGKPNTSAMGCLGMG